MSDLIALLVPVGRASVITAGEIESVGIHYPTQPSLVQGLGLSVYFDGSTRTFDFFPSLSL